jgi:sugar/nucleoside kinase (ribokinase family)
MNPRFISVGEALVEIMRPSPGHPLDRPGEFIGPFPSGAPAIMAVATARLGNEVGFIGAVGDDAFGRLLLNRFTQEGVDSSLVQVPKGRATGVAFVAYEEDGSREFIFHVQNAAAGALRPERLEPDYFTDVAWLHISGSTLALGADCRAACERALKLTKDNGGKLSFDPNLRTALMPIERSREVFAPFIQAADVLLPTIEEAHSLAERTDDDSAAQALLSGEAQIVILKRGREGCSVYHRDQHIDVAGFAVEEVDPTGAGDCFNAAFLTGLEHGWPLEKVARFANAAGALAVTKQGPMEGAPTHKEIGTFLELHYKEKQ